MIQDTQRSKVHAVESTLFKRDIATSLEDVKDLVAGVCFDYELPPVDVTYGEDRLVTMRSEIHVPLWARKPIVILHSLAHLLTDPVFPPHGAEFAAHWLELTLRCHDFLAADMRAEFDAHGIHYDSEIKQSRARRYAVFLANNRNGARVELVADDPPERIVGPIDAVDEDSVVLGRQRVHLPRLRYVQVIT